MPKYCTWESKRQRWVYQRRVPRDLREHFGGRSVIREHIGRVDEALARAHAERRTAELDVLFAQLRGQATGKHPEVTPATSVVRFTLDAELFPRFLATWRFDHIDRFETALRDLRGVGADSWDAFATDLQQQRAQALYQFRSGSSAPLADAVAAIEQALQVRLTLPSSETESAADRFNSHRLSILDGLLNVLAGKAPLDELKPAPEERLPLVELWGTPASTLIPHWEDRHLGTTDEIATKTRDKYRCIAADLQSLLSRRPVETTTVADLRAIIQLWQGRGNATTTGHGKLAILKSLLRPFLSEENLNRLFAHFRRPAAQRAPKRLPFSAAQLTQFLRLLMKHPSVTEDDLHFVELLALTGAHLDEVYRLRAEDLEPIDSNLWRMRISDRNAHDAGTAKLKTPACNRILVIAIPDDIFGSLDTWLRQRVEDGGFLFVHGSKNRHGSRSDAAGKRLGRILRRLFPDEPRLVLQSLRNTVGRVLRQAGVDPRIRRRYLGHADIDIHDRHYDPAELLDEDDLLPAALAVADWLRSECFGIAQHHREGNAGLLQHSSEMRAIDLNAFSEQQPALDMQ